MQESTQMRSRILATYVEKPSILAVALKPTREPTQVESSLLAKHEGVSGLMVH